MDRRFEVEKLGRTGNVLETTSTFAPEFNRAARQVVRRRGYKLATLRVSTPSIAQASIYKVTSRGVKYERED